LPKELQVMNLGAAITLRVLQAIMVCHYRRKDGIKHYILGVERIIANAEELRIRKGIYHSAPISLRFVNRSSAIFIMMNGEPKCMIEIRCLSGHTADMKYSTALRMKMYKIKARPHWDSYNNIPERKGIIPGYIRNTPNG